LSDRQLEASKLVCENKRLYAHERDAGCDWSPRFARTHASALRAVERSANALSGKLLAIGVYSPRSLKPNAAGAGPIAIVSGSPLSIWISGSAVKASGMAASKMFEVVSAVLVATFFTIPVTLSLFGRSRKG